MGSGTKPMSTTPDASVMAPAGRDRFRKPMVSSRLFFSMGTRFMFIWVSCSSAYSQLVTANVQGQNDHDQQHGAELLSGHQMNDRGRALHGADGAEQRADGKGLFPAAFPGFFCTRARKSTARRTAA